MRALLRAVWDDGVSVTSPEPRALRLFAGAGRDLGSDINAAVMDAVLAWLSVTAAFALYFTLLRVGDIGWLPLNTLQMASNVLLWGATLMRRRLPMGGRVAVLIVFFAIRGIAGTFTFGPASGMPFFVAETVMCAVFLPFGIALLAVIGSVLVMAACFLLCSFGVLAWPHIEPAAHHLTSWLPTMLGGFALLAAGPMAAVSSFKQRAGEHERRARQQAWALRAHGEAALALARSQSSREVVDRVCAAMVQDSPYTLALIAFAEDAPGKPVRIVGAAGASAAYAARLRLSWSADLPEGRGPAGLALRSGRPYVVADTATDPCFHAWRTQAAQAGLRSLVVVPFTRNGRPPGLVSVYAAEPNAFGPDEIELFTSLGRDLSFALAAYEDRARLDLETLRLQRLVAAAHSPIVSIDPEGAIALFNQAAEKAFGYKAAEVLGRPLDILIPEGSIAAHRLDMADFIDGKQQSRKMAPAGEAHGRRRNGEIFPIDVSITRIDTPEGKFSTAIITDLTERKSFEEKLVKSAKMEAFGQLSGGVAHDFNNLLNVIVLNADIIGGELMPDSPEAAAYARIKRTCTRGADLVKRMMSIARQAPAARTPVDIGVVLDDLLVIFKQSLGKHIAITLRREDEGLEAVVDLAQLQTSLLNLAINARDAMPDGGKLDLAARRLTGGNGKEWIEITVRDTGAGIPADRRQAIFEPFHTSKDEGKGTGLGLAMVKRFVMESAGQITVESEVGAGTCFTLRLPSADAFAVEALIPAAS